MCFDDHVVVCRLDPAGMDFECHLQVCVVQWDHHFGCDGMQVGRSNDAVWSSVTLPTAGLHCRKECG
jgi:hypothetical protein